MRRLVFLGFLMICVPASRSAVAEENSAELEKSTDDSKNPVPALFQFSNAKPDRAESRRLQRISNDKTALRVWPVLVDTGCLQGPIGPVYCAIPGHPFLAWQTHDTTQRDNKERFYWRGAIASQRDIVSLSVVGDIYGDAFTSRYQFIVSPLGQGLHAVQWQEPSHRDSVRKHNSGVLIDRAPKYQNTADAPVPAITRVAAYRWPARPRALFATESIKYDSLTSDAREQYDSMSGDEETQSIQVVRLGNEPLTAETPWITISSPEEVTLSAFRMDALSNSKRRGEFRWIGALVISEFSQLKLSVNGPVCTGTLQYANQTYRIEPLSERLHALIQVDQDEYPPDEPEKFPSGALED